LGKPTTENPFGVNTNKVHAMKDKPATKNFAVSHKRKEVKTMNYEKPELIFLGDASQMIEACDGHKGPCGNDGSGQSASGAYDLDE
jgi:hypothetical protein